MKFRFHGLFAKFIIWRKVTYKLKKL